MKIHAIQTGVITLNRSGGEVRGAETLRRLNQLMHRPDGDDFPILAWLIEHHEGLILVDTGAANRPEAACADEFDAPSGAGTTQTVRERGAGFTYRLNLTFSTPPEAEIGPRLKAMGIALRDIRRVVLTHMHPDHAGGIRFFSDAELMLSRTEYESTLRRVAKGCPRPWPDGVLPRLIDFEPPAFGPFDYTSPITHAGDVFAIPTPGHTRGHLSVIIRPSRGNEPLILFTGDAAFSQQTLLAGQLAGIPEHVRQARETHEKLRQMVGTMPTIVLTAHDPLAAARLDKNEVARAEMAA